MRRRVKRLSMLRLAKLRLRSARRRSFASRASICASVSETVIARRIGTIAKSIVSTNIMAGTAIVNANRITAIADKLLS